MKNKFRNKSFGPLAALSLLVVIIFMIICSSGFTRVSANEESGWRTTSRETDFPNYDIREDKAATQIIAGYRERIGLRSVDVEDFRKRSYAGQERLGTLIPKLRVERDGHLGTPEVIAPDVNRGWAVLTGPSAEKHSEILRSFIRQNASLVGVDVGLADRLRVRAEYTNPDGKLSYVHLEQFINDIPVFRGEIKAGFTKRGEMFRVINALAPMIDENSVSRQFGDPADAVRNAFKYVSRPMGDDDARLNTFASSELKSIFGDGDSATTVEKMYFPVEVGIVRRAWRVLIWQSVNAYYLIIDAETGTMLWRKNLTSDQTQTATYGFYNGDSPSPLSPSNATPGSGIQGTAISRTTVSLIGNEAPNLGQDDLGWITDGTNVTDGNNVEAGVDLALPDGVDAPVAGSPNRVFDFAYDPPPGGSDSPNGTAFRNGAVTNVFYWANRYHDLLYSVGFTEAAGNFQNSNFLRGGSQNDRLRAEIQDFSGTNNANFTTPADGLRPKMQTYLFTVPSPQRDSGLDAEVFIHELTHGTSSRLIGNGSGLTSLRAQSLGEGWSDFYTRLILATASEDLNGIYPVGGYSTLELMGLGTDNYYYGIRRFPYALKTTVGGPSNRPHNPLTFADIDLRQASIADGAFPQSPVPLGDPSEEHSAGEVWCMALLEVRARIITSLGFAAGTKRMAQIVTDGMKLGPVNPNFVQARDAIVSADQASFGGSDLNDIWNGFAVRGMGFGATDNGTTVVESFVLPNAVVTDPFSVSDSTGDNDGFPEPGESVLLSVAVTNTIGSAVSNVVVNVDGGGSASYGNIADGNTKTRQIPFTIPFSTACGHVQKVTLSVSSSNAPGPNVSTRKFRVGKPPSAPRTFTNTSPITINDGTVSSPAPASPYGGPIFVSGLSGSTNLRVGFTGFSHTYPGDVDMLLLGPHGKKMIVMSDTVAASHAVNTNFSLTDSAADAMPLDEPIINGGEYRPTDFSPSDLFPSPAPAGPYLSPEPSGSATFGSVFGSDTANLNGTWQLYIVDDFGNDVGSISGGWYLEFETSDGYTCSFASSHLPRADFDGDGKADLSSYRPSDNNWYIFQSGGGGALVRNWGIAGDVLTPGDFDGDGKADTTIYRPSSGQWFIFRSSDSTVNVLTFGIAGDIPVAGDYDGDGKTDVAQFRPSEGVWYVFRSSDNGVSITTWGEATDLMVPADYDGDGKTDVAVFRPSTGVWYVFRSTAGPMVVGWGVAGDKPVDADYDGDGKDDVAIYRPSEGNWYVFRSSDNTPLIVNWGNATDVPSPGDYDGDGKDDFAVFRVGTWFAYESTAGPVVSGWGTAGDISIPSKYIP